MMLPPVRACALTVGFNQPSTRFRWLQYADILLSAGVVPSQLQTRRGAFPPRSQLARPAWLLSSAVDAYGLVQKANQSDVRFLQREMISTLYTAEYFLKEPFIFDVDDAIFLSQRFSGIDRIARRASLVICGNSYLQDYFAKFSATVVLPTGVDTIRFYPSRPVNNSRTIGWSGSSSGFSYLYKIESALCTVLARHPDVTLRIVADRPPAFAQIPASRVNFIQWNAESEVATLQDLAVGIMPLADGPWEKGKCSFKMLTYMAVSVPVVVSAVGMNTEVMAHGEAGYLVRNSDEWVDALSELLSSDGTNKQMGLIGRRIIEDHFAASTVGARLAQILKDQV